MQRQCCRLDKLTHFFMVIEVLVGMEDILGKKSSLLCVVARPASWLQAALMLKFHEAIRMGSPLLGLCHSAI